MGKRKTQVDEINLLALRGQGKNLRDISKELGVSVPTISRRIAVLKYQEGILTKYRELQGLQLTQLQIRVLDAITPEKIEKASLLELVRAFEILKRMESAIEGKAKIRIWGLLAHLQAMEGIE